MNERMREKSPFVKLGMNFIALVLLAVISVMILIVYFNKSLGWFVNNKTVSGESMSARVEKNDADANYYAYVYDVKESTSSQTVVHFTGEGTSDDPAIDNLDILFFDTIFKKRNRYTPAVVRIELSELKYTAGTVTLTLTRDSALPTTETASGKTAPSRYLTSAMRFTAAQGKDWYTYSPATAAADLYNRIDTSLYTYIATDRNYTAGSVSASGTNAYAFHKSNSLIFVDSVNKDGTGALIGMTKADAISLSVPYAASDLLDTDGDGVGDTLNVYLYITYDEDLVENFGVSGISSGGSAVGQIIDLANDLTEMKITLTGN